MGLAVFPSTPLAVPPPAVLIASRGTQSGWCIDRSAKYHRRFPSEQMQVDTAQTAEIFNDTPCLIGLASVATSTIAADGSRGG